MRVAIALVALALSADIAADDIARARTLQQQAAAAKAAGDLPAHLDAMRKASALRPQHPTMLMLLAEALAVNGRDEEAVAVMRRVADMGFVYALDRPALASLRAARGADAVAPRFEKNRQPMGTAQETFTVGRKGLIAEGLAWDQATNRFFLSSVRTGEILVRQGEGEARTFAKMPWGAFGIAADKSRNALWVTTAALPYFADFDAAQKGKSQLVRLDLATGAHVAAFESSDEGDHHFGDVVVSESGDVFVSDGAANVLYRMNEDRLERFASGFTALQGIAPAGRVIYAADYSRGVVAIDPQTRDWVALRVPDDVSLLGVDGLYPVPRCRRCLIATQNGTNPNRILAIRLTPDGLGVASTDTLLANTLPMRDPTLGVVAGARFHFNANARWDLYGEDGKVGDEAQLEPAVVLSVPVPK